MKLPATNSSVASPGPDIFVADMTLPLRGPGSATLQDALLARFLKAGFNFTSITVGGDDLDAMGAIKSIAKYRAFVLAKPDICVLVDGIDDIILAKAAGKIAVSFHFQGTVPVGRDLSLVDIFYKLGIRHMLMAYNQKNFVADGCHEIGGGGLSRFGRELVTEMNRVGMFVDVAHTSYAASMEVIEHSNHPVIVSHGNVWALHQHPRCYRDDQIKAIAASGGVIGLTGLSLFIGNEERLVESYVRQIDYVAQLVGVQHVGLGFDYVYDMPALLGMIRGMESKWPAEGGYNRTHIAQVEPESIGDITEELIRKGYREQDVRAIMGENWLRLMRQIWK